MMFTVCACEIEDQRDLSAIRHVSGMHGMLFTGLCYVPLATLATPVSQLTRARSATVQPKYFEGQNFQGWVIFLLKRNFRDKIFTDS